MWEMNMKTRHLETGRIQLDTHWGPFSPTYLGISRILDAERGSMVNFALSVARRSPARTLLPETTFGYVPQHSGERRAEVFAVPEDVRPDYSGYAIRYFLDPHGDTAVARFTVESDQTAACGVTFRNTSDQEREYTCGLGLLIADPGKKVQLQESLKPWWVPAR